MLKDVLSYEAEYYKSANVDIAVFDSSENDETQSLVMSFTERGFDNIFYRRTAPDSCIDCKIIEIWSQFRFLREYKYIWLINDSISIYPDALNEILEYMDDEYTLIRLPVEGSGSRDDLVTTDINKWFISCSKGMGHMASTIMNTKLLDEDIDWIMLQDKYVKNNDINSPDHGFFFTVGFYLERIAAAESFRGILIGNRKKWRRDSPLKMGKSYWDQLIFEVWARSYTETIIKTPDIYHEKERVIKESDNVLFGRFEKQSLISLRIRGLFSKNECTRYKKYWKYVSTLSMKELLEIAEAPVEELKRQYGDDYGLTGKWKDNLLSIEKKIGQKKIIVYGAGLYGQYVISQLIKDGFEKQLLGVAVSDPAQNVSVILGIPVKGISFYDEYRKDAMVIISTLPDTALAIKNTLEELDFKFSDRIF